MLFALSLRNEIGLACVGVAFIIFSLLSSFVFPRLMPDFPSRAGMRWYLPLCFCFFIAMLSAVLVFGRDKGSASAATAATTTAPGGTTTTGNSYSAGKLTSGPYANGNPALGKAVFTSVGCTACHTFAAAGATGTIGPDLDKIGSYSAKANVPLEQFIAEAITAPPAPYVPPGYPTNVMLKDGGRTLTDSQIANLVAFIATEAKG